MPESMTPEVTEDLLPRLSANPLRIAQAVAGRSEVQLQTAPAGGGWSAADVLAHIRASDDILAYRAYAILARENPPLPSYDDRRWAEVAGYRLLQFHESLHAFSLRRAELVLMLRRASPVDWQRMGVHEVSGPLALFDIIRTLIEHEEEHCAQLEAIGE